MMLERHHIDKPGNRRLKLEGKKFGRLSVLKFHDIRTRKGNKRESRWLCECDCGNEVILVGSSIKSGKTSSCGCLQKENPISHGLSYDPLYFVWKAMIRRCENKTDANYHHYGGRGIKVCDEWKDLETFVGWCNNNGFEEGLEIDRIDNSGNYSPENIRFVTRRKNMLNTRRNINVDIGGVTKTLIEWANEYGIKVNTMQYRYHRGDRGQRLVRSVESKYSSPKGGGQ